MEYFTHEFGLLTATSVASTCVHVQSDGIYIGPTLQLLLMRPIYYS